MKLVIIPIDGAVYVDGQSHSGLDLSMCPGNVHALQWKGEAGWIEFLDNDDGTKPQNEAITELPDWALQAKAKWEEEQAAAEAARLEKQAEAEAATTQATQGA